MAFSFAVNNTSRGSCFSISVMRQTLFEKLWREHLITELDDGASLLYIDRVFLHERTGSIALKSLEFEGHRVQSPEQVFCVMDHIVDTFPGRGDNTRVPSGKDFIQQTRQAALAADINLLDVNDPHQGIVHVVSPELGIVQPGATLVCPDSHTCSQGALGALAWGIGSSEAEHVLATKTLRVNQPKTMRVNFNGQLARGVTAKDMILALIARHGSDGGGGYAIEFTGDAVSALDIEARLTLCNMAVEFSAFTGIIAVDDKTIRYMKDRKYSPKGEEWLSAEVYWRTLHSDDDAQFDAQIEMDCSDLSPMVTWGNSPQHAIAISEKIPLIDLEDRGSAESILRAQEYMAVQSGQSPLELKIDGAFIGSCTNSRISDLRAAADILRGRKVAEGVRAICVPGSTQVKRQAEAEGLDEVFIAAGFEWRESGCSMCFYAGGESFGFRERVITSTNRNFESRQGPETRSHLASPETVAASALMGHIVDVRDYLR